MVPAMANMAAPATLTDFERRRRRLPLDLQASFPLQGETMHGSNSPRTSHGSQLRLGTNLLLPFPTKWRPLQARKRTGDCAANEDAAARPAANETPATACCWGTRGGGSAGWLLSWFEILREEHVGNNWPASGAALLDFPRLAEGSCSSAGLWQRGPYFTSVTRPLRGARLCSWPFLSCGHWASPRAAVGHIHPTQSPATISAHDHLPFLCLL